MSIAQGKGVTAQQLSSLGPGEHVHADGDVLASPTGLRIVFLDSLRFVASAAVVFQHVIEKEGHWGELIVAALSPGVFGVVLFFIISGFVIPMAARKRLSFGTFVLRRIFRIYPLVLTTFAILAIAGYGGLLPSLSFFKEVTARDWIANLLLIQDYVGATTILGVTWTLNLEFAWYAIFVISLLVLGRRFDNWLAIIAPLALSGLALLSFLMDHRLPLARMGMVYAAVLGTRFYQNQLHTLSRPRLLLDLLIFMFVMTACNVVSFGYFKHPNITLSQAVCPWLAASASFALVALLKNVRDSRLVNSAIIGWLGAISFSTYLLHSLAMFIAHDYFPADFFVAISLMLTLVFSAIGYYVVELPGQKLGRCIETVGRRKTSTHPVDRSTERVG